MQIVPTRLPEVLEITPRRFGDDRGFFSESWNRDSWAAAGIDHEFTQDNHSLSAEPGVLRGLHFQAPPRAQDKLVRVVTGAVLDVAVDIRKGSPRYGHWVSVEISAEKGNQLLVPKGFLHGFLTLTPDTHFLYKCTDTYAPEAEGAVIWNDADIGIDWGIDAAIVTLSDKDRVAPRFSDFSSPFVFEG
jgi:dTDP-4-dehydrorhamnose 3,5-epimerase